MIGPKELYLFDTMGFLHIPQLFSPEEVRDMLDALHAAPSVPVEHANTTRHEDLAEQDDCFARLARDPRLLTPVQAFINQPMRLIESYSFRRSGPSVLYLHNGLSERFEREGIVAYRNMGIHHTYHDGKLYCMYVKALCYLTDIQRKADGPFCYVQGSHKANFPLIAPLASNGDYRPQIDEGFPSLAPVYVRAGDVLFLNEALLHGGYRKTTESERAFAAFSYAPAFVSDYRPLERDPDDLVAGGHYEFTEERVLRTVGYPL